MEAKGELFSVAGIDGHLGSRVARLAGSEHLLFVRARAAEEGAVLVPSRVPAQARRTPLPRPVAVRPAAHFASRTELQVRSQLVRALAGAVEDVPSAPEEEADRHGRGRQ